MPTIYFTSESFIKCLSLFVSLTLPFCFNVTHSFQIKKKFKLFVLCVHVGLCVWGWVWATLLKDSLEKLAFPFPYVCPGDWTLAIRFGGRRLYPLSRLASPGYFGKWVWWGLIDSGLWKPQHKGSTLCSGSERFVGKDLQEPVLLVRLWKMSSGFTHSSFLKALAMG